MARAATVEKDLNEVDANAQTSAAPIQLLPITAVRESSENVRTFFDEEKLAQLKADIAANGQREPVQVSPADAAGYYELIDGARRFRCIKALMEEGHPNAPLFIEARVKEHAGGAIDLLFARLSSFNREELSPIDEARAYQKLKEMLDYERACEGKNRHAGTVLSVIAERLGVSVRHVEQRIALLDLAAPVLEDLAAGIITVSHADELARLPNARQIPALMACVENQLSVRGLKDWLREKGWTKTAERDAHGNGVEEQEGGGSGADSDARGNAGTGQGGADGVGSDGYDDGDRVGSSADGDEAEAEDVIEEAQADMDRQKNAAAVAEAKRAENDTTPDAEQHQGEEETEESRLAQAKRAIIAKHIVRAVLGGWEEHWVAEICKYFESVYDNTSENTRIAVRSIHPKADSEIDNLGQAAGMLVALKFSEYLQFPNSEQPDWNGLCEKYGLDIEECALEAQAQMLGVSVDELKQNLKVKNQNSKAKKPRADKGKAKPSPKVAKKVRAEKVSALQIKKNVAATKKAKGKGKKK